MQAVAFLNKCIPALTRFLEHVPNVKLTFVEIWFQTRGRRWFAVATIATECSSESKKATKGPQIIIKTINRSNCFLKTNFSDSFLRLND